MPKTWVMNTETTARATVADKRHQDLFLVPPYYMRLLYANRTEAGQQAKPVVQEDKEEDGRHEGKEALTPLAGNIAHQAVDGLDHRLHQVL